MGFKDKLQNKIQDQVGGKLQDSLKGMMSGSSQNGSGGLEGMFGKDGADKNADLFPKNSGLKRK